MKNSYKKKVLVLSFSYLDSDPRVHRQILFLKDIYKVTAAGFSKPAIDNVQFARIEDYTNTFKDKVLWAVKLKSRAFEKFYWSSPQVQSSLALLRDRYFDLIIANDIETLALACCLSKRTGAKVLLDAHEYTPRELDNKFLFRFFFQDYWDYLCRSYLPCASAMTTVCEGIAEEYEKIYGVNCHVVTNAPFFSNFQPSAVSDDVIRMVHHGAAIPSRKIENMIFLMDYLDDRFFLDLMLVNNNRKYLGKLQEMSRGNPRINFQKPVPMVDIVNFINKYDIGLYLLEPSGFNSRMALPNKLFEFIQGRLLVAIWPSPEMARIVRKYRCGVVSDNFTIQSIAKEINRLSAKDIMHFKHQTHEAASVLCAETNKKVFLSIVGSLIGK